MRWENGVFLMAQLGSSYKNQLEDDPAPGEDDFEDVGDGQAGRRCRVVVHWQTNMFTLAPG